MKAMTHDMKLNSIQFSGRYIPSLFQLSTKRYYKPSDFHFFPSRLNISWIPPSDIRKRVILYLKVTVSHSNSQRPVFLLSRCQKFFSVILYLQKQDILSAQLFQA